MPGIGASRAANGAYVAAVIHRTALLACMHGLIYGTLFGAMQTVAPLLSAPLARLQFTGLWWIPATTLTGMLLGAVAVDWPGTFGLTPPSEYALTQARHTTYSASCCPAHSTAPSPV